MNNRIVNILIICGVATLFCFVLSDLVFALPITGSISEGNRLFKRKAYDSALKKYSEALKENPNSSIVNFNIGDVLYKQNK